MKCEFEKLDPAFYVSGLRSGGSILDKATIRCIMEGSSEPKTVDGHKEVIVFREVKIVANIYYSLLLFQNSNTNDAPKTDRKFPEKNLF